MYYYTVQISDEEETVGKSLDENGVKIKVEM